MPWREHQTSWTSLGHWELCLGLWRLNKIISVASLSRIWTNSQIVHFCCISSNIKIANKCKCDDLSNAKHFTFLQNKINKNKHASIQIIKNLFKDAPAKPASSTRFTMHPTMSWFAPKHWSRDLSSPSTPSHSANGSRRIMPNRSPARRDKNWRKRKNSAFKEQQNDRKTRRRSTRNARRHRRLSHICWNNSSPDAFLVSFSFIFNKLIHFLFPARISSRPGQSGRCDGYILEGKELEFYLKKVWTANFWFDQFEYFYRSVPRRPNKWEGQKKKRRRNPTQLCFKHNLLLFEIIVLIGL